jgi:trigger factor
MKTELLGQEKQEKNIVTIKMEFEAEEFIASVNQTIQDVAAKNNVPGFRKGHIPRKVIEMRFGKDTLYTESLEKMLPGALEQVIADYDLNVVSSPSLKVVNMREGEPLVCEATFELSPEVTLPELGDIEVEKARSKVTDEMVEEAVASLKTRHSTWNPVERPAGKNDAVSITSVTKGESPRTNDVDLSDPTLGKELRDVLLGKSKGDKTFLDIEDDSQEKIRYDIVIDEVKERIFPEMTPEFYKRILGIELETEEAFREELRTLIHNQIERDSLVYAGKAAFDAVVARAELEISDSLLTRQIELMKQRDADNCKERYKVSMEEYLRNASITLPQYEQQVRVQAMQVLRRDLVLEAIVKKFDIKVDKKALDEEIFYLAFAQKEDPVKFKAAFRKDKKRMDQLAVDLRNRRVILALMDNVKIKEADTPDSSDALSQITPAETPTETPIEAPIETPTEAFLEAPIETPIEVPMKAPAEVPFTEVNAEIPTTATPESAAAQATVAEGGER